MHEYVLSLREGIMDAWDGAIIAMTVGEKQHLIAPHVEHIFSLIHSIFSDQTRTEALFRSSMGVVG
jgi:importin subunit beta-1